MSIQFLKKYKRISVNIKLETKKKVILYNTGLVSMLEHKEAMLDKIENVLQTFREKQDELRIFTGIIVTVTR